MPITNHTYNPRSREDFYRIVETVFDPETGEEVEEFTRYLCKRCAAKSEGRRD